MLVPWLPDTAPAVHPFIIVLAALVLDALIGDPAWLPHPIAGLGRLIGVAEVRFNRGAMRVFRGAALAVGIVAACAALGLAVVLGARSLPAPWGLGVEAGIASILIAYRGLHNHVRRVAEGLEVSVEAGRRAVGHIVGRRTETLDSAGVARAAIESAAENFSDGVVAPVFWFALFGLPGLFAYKAVNTLDSMIGHHDPRYREFGRFAARLDDVANWVPARVAAALIALAAVLDAGRAFAVVFRDASKHRSPNAGWPEAAMAGALDRALLGPRDYAGGRVDGAWLGDGSIEATAEDIRACLLIVRRAALFLALALTVGAL